MSDEKLVEKKVAEKVVKEPTFAEKLWEEVKGKELKMFALPSQTVEAHCKAVTVEPSKLYLTYTASAVLPALEEALGSGFQVEAVDKFIVVSKK